MDDGNQVFRQGESAALLVIEFPSFRDFIDAYSPIISEQGIFIRNADVSESNAFSVGDRVDFEVRLKDDFRLIQGAGEVVWLGPSDAAGGAPGTAIRFRDLDEPSKRLISRLVGNYERDGGKLFEIGPEAVEEDPVPTPEAEPGALGDLEPPPPDASHLTAENLDATEADELFAGEDEEPAAPVEFESVSLDEVERSRLEEPSPPPEPERPVGLDTIAIPSGLMTELTSKGQDEPGERVDASVALNAPDAPGLGPLEPDAEEAGGLPEQQELPAEPVEAPPIPDETTAVVDAGPSPSEASFSGVAPPESFEPPAEDDFDQTALEAAAVSMDGELGGGGIPDDIAQVAEELSGVHRVELPDPEEASGVGYAGSASVGRERNIGGWFAALSVVVVLLGAGAFLFKDSILGFLGRGGEESASILDPSNRAGGSMPAVPAPLATDPGGSEATSGAAVPEAATSEPPSAEAESEVESGPAPELEPVQVIVERDSAPTAESAGTGSDESTDGQARAGTPRAASAAPDSSEPPAAEAVAQRVERITFSEAGGETIVSIRLSAEISSAQVEVVRVRDGAPREVIKIRGVEVPYAPREVPVGTPHVERLRTGLHRGAAGSALHVVADLTGAGVTVLSVEPKGRDLLITFS